MPAKSSMAPARRRRARNNAVVQAATPRGARLGESGVDPARQHRVDLDVVFAQATAQERVSWTMPPLLAA